MTVEDFSIEFDLLFNNIASNKAPGLNDYEKSLFLTQAQELVVRGLYSSGEQSFESTEELTSYLSSVTKRMGFSSFDKGELYGWDTYTVELPSKVWYITLENGVVDNLPVEIIPVKQDLFLRTVRNPFRGPTDKRALRITRTDGDVARVSDIIPCKGKRLQSYEIHYVEKPKPIVLEDNIEIDGEIQSRRTCCLPENMHRMVLIRAVELAKSVWQ